MGAGKSKGAITLPIPADETGGLQRRHSVTSLTEIEPSKDQPVGIRRTRSSLSLPRRLSHCSTKRSQQKHRSHTLPSRPGEAIDDAAKGRKKVTREAKSLKAWVEGKSNESYEVPCLAELASLAIVAQLKSAEDIAALPIFQELKYALEFRFCPTFDDSGVPEKVVFSNGNRAITYTGRGYSTTCVKTPFDKGLRNGRHAWLVHVDVSRVVGWMHIGVVNEKRKESGCRTIWDGNPHPFREGETSRSSNGNFNSGICERQVQSMQFTGGYTTGDTIAVKLDLDAGTIQWMKNGEDYGEVVQIADDTYYPSVSLDSPGEGVTLVFYTGTPGV